MSDEPALIKVHPDGELQKVGIEATHKGVLHEYVVLVTSMQDEVMARVTALIYNWGTIFVRLGIPEKHAEAITSRPLALHGIARRTRHANQTTVEVTSTHSKAQVIAEAPTKVSGFLKRIKATVEHLIQPTRWRLILSAAFQHFLGGRSWEALPDCPTLPANCCF